MKALIAFSIRSASAFTATIVVFLVSMLAFSQGFFPSIAIGMIGGGITFYSAKQIQTHRYAKEQGLTKREYEFISENLKEAKAKILRLQRSFVQIRRLGSMRENHEILKLTKRIYANTKREPKRFFQAEAFFYKHLDSLVEIAEKYAYLSEQPVKTKEMNEMMRDSRHAIISLGQTVNKDLQIMLKDDVDTLHFELDVAKKTIDKPKTKNGRVTS